MLCYSRTATMFTEKIIADSEYVENISLSELQPPQLRTICYVLFRSFLHVLPMWTLFFFFLFSLALFSFLFCFFFLMLFVSVHKILILSSLSPNDFLFFSSLNFSYGYFSTFQTCHHNCLFFLTQLVFHLLGLLQ